ITPLIHSSVQVEVDGRVIQVDPWSAGDLSRAKPADLVLITDDPIHHLDPKAIRQLRKPDATVFVPAASHAKFPEGTAIANGETRTVNGITVEAIPAYDIIPGEPSHPKGKSNGYIVTVSGQRLYFAGVTECVPEVRALKNIAVAFIPMNIPLGRMLPAAAADCVKAIKPKAVYVYHYDQNYAAGRPSEPGIAASVMEFRNAIEGSGIEFREGNWYPVRKPLSLPRVRAAAAGAGLRDGVDVDLSEIAFVNLRAVVAVLGPRRRDLRSLGHRAVDLDFLADQLVPILVVDVLARVQAERVLRGVDLLAFDLVAARRAAGRRLAQLGEDVVAVAVALLQAAGQAARFVFRFVRGGRWCGGAARADGIAVGIARDRLRVAARACRGAQQRSRGARRDEKSDVHLFASPADRFAIIRT